MNPIIKQLALEAGGSHYPEVNPVQLQKFAELIVRECAALVKGQPHVDKMMDCNSVIKQHFGVEE